MSLAPDAGRPRVLRLPALALVAANLVPLAGVALFGWSLAEVMLLFWAESAVIGALAVAKMLVAGRARAAPLAGFFVFHYGMFMLVHLVFVWTLFVDGESVSPVALGIPLAALAASHAASFWRDFLHGPERGRDTRSLMGAPYARIIPMHLAILGGGWLLMTWGTPRPALAILVLVKTAIDLGLFLALRPKG